MHLLMKKGLILISGIVIFATSLLAVNIGGYGELHLNISKKEGFDRQYKLDFHRFVLFASHQFDEHWSFFSELELEHNFVKDGQGELELEQAFIQYRFSSFLSVNAGVILPRVGILNTHHEPPLFASVERPDYHKIIIPTTWFGNGLAITGKISSFQYQLAVMEGLDGNLFSPESGIRNSRRKGFEADVRNPLFVFSLDYQKSDWLAGFSISHNNSNSLQGHIPMTLLEGHFKYDANRFYFVTEIGRIDYGTPSDLKSSFGFYTDIGYDIAPFLGIPGKLHTWFRYSRLNTGADFRTADFPEDTYLTNQWLAGIHYRPLSEISIKADFGVSEKGADRTRTAVFNLGIGYMF